MRNPRLEDVTIVVFKEMFTRQYSCEKKGEMHWNRDV